MSRRTRTATSLGLTTMIAIAAALSFFPETPGAKPDASLASGGLDGSSGFMQPMDLPARVSRVAVVPGTGDSEAWAIGQMERSDPEWGDDQTVFLHWQRGQGWSVYGPPKDESGAVVKDLILSNLSFASNGEAWAVGLTGALVHHPPGGGWNYRSACAPGGPMADACGDISGVSVIAAGGETTGFAVGPSRSGGANTMLKLSGGTWSLDNAPLVPDPSPVIDFVSVAAVSGQDGWAIGTTSARELQIFRRVGVAWTRQRTNKPLFDNPAPSNDGRTVNLSAFPTSVAASPDGTTVWFGGGISPVDPGRPLGQADAPFALRWRSGEFRSYCPRQYSLHNDTASFSNICDDRQGFPMSPYDISSISVLSNDEAFAGGGGLFHYKNGTWWREPNTAGYLSSVSFFSASEGWVASSGNTKGGGGPAISSSTTVGHYTSPPGEKRRTAPWPHFNKRTLFGVAVAPSGGTAIAFGNGGSTLLYEPQQGWQYIGNAGDSVLRAAAWSDARRAWAVGDRGAIASYEGRRVELEPRIVDASLYSVAMAGGSGYAVGERGTILRFSGGKWSKDPSTGIVGETLYDIASVGGGFVAVGGRGTVLVNPSGSPGGWSVDNEVANALPNRPALLAVAGTRGGTLVISGQRRSLIVRPPGGPYQKIARMDNNFGAILDLAASDTPSGPRIFAVATEFEERFRVRRTSLLAYEGGRWRDLDMSSKRVVHPSTDRPGIPDPVFSISLDPNGRSGWAVGGIVPRVSDQPDSTSYYEDQTSAIYRFDLSGDADPPMAEAVSGPAPGSTFSFAYFSESSCGQAESPGFCSIGVGTGMMPDEAALKIQDEINEASRRPGGPEFVVFGGSMRTEGRPEELEAFKGFLSDFKVPVLAALGPQDLFYSNASGQAEDFIPELPDDDLERAIGPRPKVNAAASNRFSLETFADQCAPWGTEPKPSQLPGRCRGILPVEVGRAPTNGLARTHYAFDFASGSRRLARFVVLDTSDFLFAKPGQAATSQNPPNQDQSAWLSQVIQDAKSYSPPLSVIVISNVPTSNPLTAVHQPTLVDGKTFEAAATSLGISAVLTGYLRANASYSILGQVPVYVLGGGGAPPPQSSSKYPNDGHYNAWGLISVNTANTRQLHPGALPQASVHVAPVPVVESVALHPLQGLNVAGGWTLQFQALAKAIPGGTPPNDPHQKRMAYLQFPTSTPCLTDGQSGAGGYCLNQSAMRPDYHFVSESPDVVDFVRPGGIPGYPLVLNGFLIKDDQSGFLCSFKAGKAWIKIVSGSKQMRMQVTVGAGFGPCVDHPVLVTTLPKPGRVIAELAPAPISPAAKTPHLLFNPPNFPESLVVVLPPVPAPIAAPAPPASAAGSRKEEEEAQLEEQGDEGENESRVLGYQRRRAGTYDPVLGWMMLGGAGLLGLIGALAATSVRESRRRLEPQEAYVEWRKNP